MKKSSGVNIFLIPLLILLALQLTEAYRLPSFRSTRKPFRTDIPYNIAHRGSNGELPEETAFAYKRAIEEGAAFIETDIIATKDGQLICFHDLTLDATTNIADRPEFAKRKATYNVSGTSVTGFFTVDFTLEELKTLRARQRLSFRDQSYNDQLEIITFEEFIAIALNAPRTVGIYPEIKNPVFINSKVKWSKGRRFEDVFVETLVKYGYKGSYLSQDWLKQPLFIQSFAPSSLLYIANKTDSPKVLLLDEESSFTEDTNQSFAEITSDSYLDFISKTVVGLGPWKETLKQGSDLVDKAHVRGLQVHPYTFRNEYSYLHSEYHQDPYEEYDHFVKALGVDGVFTDFPGTFQHYLLTLHSVDANT